MEIRKFNSPKRKSLAGPRITTSSSDQLPLFQITNSYSRESQKAGDPIRKAMIAMENLQIDGNLSVVSSIATNKEVLCIKYTEEFESIAAGFNDGMIRVFHSTGGEMINTLQDQESLENTAPVTSIEHRPVSKNYPIINCLTCTYANGCIKCWNYNFGQCLYTIREKRQTYGLTYHPRLPKFVTYGNDLKIYLYDEESHTQERILSASDVPGSIDGHASRIFAACFNPRSNHELITGGWDDVVYFWDFRQPHALRHLSKIHMCGEGLSISQSGNEILTCSWQKENPLQLWDYGSGELIVTMEPDLYESMLYCGKFVSKNFIVVGGSDQHIFKVVNLQTYSMVGSITGLSGGVYSVDIGPPKKLKKGHKDAPTNAITVYKEYLNITEENAIEGLLLLLDDKAARWWHDIKLTDRSWNVVLSVTVSRRIKSSGSYSQVNKATSDMFVVNAYSLFVRLSKYPELDGTHKLNMILCPKIRVRLPRQQVTDFSTLHILVD
ncbi:hypothetical protein FQA39_LY08590 [Lamprigera yunnana]|nr:hypothetical protein FQA39_LY08590 [Lamprigera yunnana]